MKKRIVNVLYVLIVSICVILATQKPWDREMHVAAMRWVDSNPQVLVTERIGSFSQVYEPMKNTDLVRQVNFNALVPANAVVKVLSDVSANKYWLYHQTTDTAAIATWFDCVPLEAPAGCTTTLTNISVIGGNIVSMYKTDTVPLLGLAWLLYATIMIVLGVKVVSRFTA